MHEWNATIPGPVPPNTNRLAVARHVKQAIPLKGYLADYLLETSEEGELLMQIYLPGRRYDVAYDRASGHARVKETRRGIWGVLRSLHGRPGAPELRMWSISWRLYSEFTLLTLCFAVLSGGVLWWPRVKSHGRELLVVVLSSGVCLGLISWLWR